MARPARPAAASGGPERGAAFRRDRPQTGDLVRLARSAQPNRMNRQPLIKDFLARCGYERAYAHPLAPDASFRRYLRLTGGPRPAVLMDAPPPEEIRPFVQIARHLAHIGLSVPEIIAVDEAAGLLLEEDL